MDYFGVGPLEILLILLLGFIIFGPKSLYELTRKAGQALRDLSSNTGDLRRQLEDELAAKPVDKRPPFTKDNSTD